VAILSVLSNNILVGFDDGLIAVEFVIKVASYIRWVLLIAARLVYYALRGVAIVVIAATIVLLTIIELMEQRPVVDAPVLDIEEYGPPTEVPVEETVWDDPYPSFEWQIEDLGGKKLAYAAASRSEEVLVVHLDSDMSRLGVRELRRMAKGRVKGFMRMNKAQLVQALS